MAEWVQKGSLMGPQGPKGEDATLPEGGTEGQFLKKTATGEEWGDVPAPDMSGYVKYSPEADKLTYDDGTEVSAIMIGDVNSGPYLQMSSNQVGIANRILNQSAGFGIHESSNHPALYLGANQGTTPKSVTGITDSISDSPEGLNLATDKAVAGYVTAHAGDTLPEGGTTGQVLTKTADGEAWQDAPQPDLTGYAYLHPSEDKTINPDTVDIRTLEPGVYRVAMGSYVDNGEMVDVGVNNTQFPDAMVNMTPYGVDRTGILTVSKTVRNDDSGNEMLFYDLQIGYPMGDGEVDRFIAQCPSPGYALDSGNWKQIPKDSDIPKDFLVISSDGNLKEFNGGPVDELAVGLATENNRASMGYFNYLGTTGVNFVAKRNDDRQAFMQASGSSSHVEVAHSGNQIGIGASAGGAFIAVKPNGGTATQYSISDAIADGTNTLATGKAVADYVSSLIATDEEFDTFFGLS